MRISIFFFALTLVVAGCNLYGKIDEPGELEDKYSAALAAANDGRCEDARNLLIGLRDPNDDVLAALGWAQLCIGGATASNIEISIYKFSSASSTSSDQSVVGALARLMLPMTGEKFNSINDSLIAFSGIQEPARRNLLMGIANFARAASVLANQAPSDGDNTLVRADIAALSCATQAADCSVSGCAAGMSDGSVTAFTGAISEASSQLRSANAEQLRSLAEALRTGFGGSAASARCYIFNNAVPAD